MDISINSLISMFQRLKGNVREDKLLTFITIVFLMSACLQSEI